MLLVVVDALGDDQSLYDVTMNDDVWTIEDHSVLIAFDRMWAADDADTDCHHDGSPTMLEASYVAVRDEQPH